MIQFDLIRMETKARSKFHELLLISKCFISGMMVAGLVKSQMRRISTLSSILAEVRVRIQFLDKSHPSIFFHIHKDYSSIPTDSDVG